MKYKYKKIKLKDGTTRDEHRLIMERYMGRALDRYEVVHHINGDSLDNRIENLELCLLSEHTRCHMKGNNPSTETRQKMSQVRKGKKFGSEFGLKMSKIRTGKRHSEETKKKISDTNKIRMKDWWEERI